ncbi:hypothetical protein [Clostridium botulinum]|uniref:hypothetical protein n=1 Tax=Clostridium botulinum TaxID=1491 RepID=UPI0009474312|nr:hypothetical protein [Clostridium botulinum]APQ78846.1 hypothetical protein RSJ10_3768 [Clostridium botulinum]MBN3355828.1 hypothetical protein [Clostridium botulinum]
MEYFNKFDGDMTKELNNIDKMKAIESWQQSKMHPLTCSKCRNNLHEDIVNGKVVLGCKCGHIQNNVPEVVYKRYKQLILDDYD